MIRRANSTRRSIQRSSLAKSVKPARGLQSLGAALERMGATERLGQQYLFPEQETDYSATLGAVRAALSRAEGRQSADTRQPTCHLVV
jgi:hypothetical protein